MSNRETDAVRAKMLYIPYVRENHWVLYVVDVERKRLFYINNLNTGEDWDSGKIIFEQLWKNLLCVSRKIDEHRCWPQQFTNALQVQCTQPDTHSCGIVVMLFMDQFDGSQHDTLAERINDLKFL